MAGQWQAVCRDYLNFWNAVDWVSIICAMAVNQSVAGRIVSSTFNKVCLPLSLPVLVIPACSIR